MKVLRLTLVVIFTLQLLSLCTAADNPFENDSVVQNVQRGQEYLDNYTAHQNKSEYLMQEWTKLLGNSKLGSVIVGISDFVSIFNPFIRLVIGFDYSLSWAFAFGFMIWLTMFMFLLGPGDALLKSRFLSILASFVLASLVGVAGVIKKIVELAAFAITNLWIALLSLALAFIIMMMAKILGKTIKKALLKARDDAEKTKEKQNREVLGAGARAVKKELDSN